MKDVSIDSKIYKSFEKAYEYALEMTKKEIHQAVEGMYHNLNTLQSMAA
jgi:ribonucleoside-triphosphate reductase